MDQRTRNKQRSKVPTIIEKFPKSEDYKDVCVLLILRDGKVLLEPTNSKKMGKVMKPLSIKFDGGKTNDEAISILITKYKLSGLYDQAKKIELVKVFEIEGKIFHVFSVRQNNGNINASGTFGFTTKMEEVVKNKSINLRGNGDCFIPTALKMAVEAALATA